MNERRKVAIVVGGGPAPGINAVIGAATIRCVPPHLHLVPRAGGEPRALTAGDLDQTDLAWSPDGRRIVFVQDSTVADELRSQPRPQLHVLTVADGAVRHLETG